MKVNPADSKAILKNFFRYSDDWEDTEEIDQEVIVDPAPPQIEANVENLNAAVDDTGDCKCQTERFARISLKIRK